MRVSAALAMVLVLATACGPKPGFGPNPPGPEPVAYEQPGLAVGAPVAAKWQDGAWYFGHITETEGNRYAIAYADGDKGTVGPGEILPIAAPGQITIGTRVLAQWKGAKMYPGVVIQVSGDRARVQWDDGDLPLDVPMDRMALLQPTTAAAPDGAGMVMGLQVGARVAAKWKDGKYWYGTVGKVDPDGYVIHYADGDVLKVPPAHVRPVPPPGSLQVGDHVIAVWKGAQMYPGIITRIDSQSATVKWDDGDTPLDVPLTMIAK